MYIDSLEITDCFTCQRLVPNKVRYFERFEWTQCDIDTITYIVRCPGLARLTNQKILCSVNQ